MNQHPEAQDRLYVRGLLAEAGVEESPELVERLFALRLQSRVPAPEPDGELAALFAGNPVPLRPRARRGRGIILGAALIGAMGVGAGGVAANPDFLVRADPRPEVTFTPEAPTLERAKPAAPEAPSLEQATPAAPAPAAVPEAAAPAPEPTPAPEAVPVQAPAAAPDPAAVPSAVPVPSPDYPGPSGNPGAGSRKDAGPHTGYVPHENRRSDGRVRDTMGPGGGASTYGGSDSQRNNSRQDGHGHSNRDR
ncbi:hypothetical protein [Arthrobacter sp. zg-Y179]|uniref:hypothetical protein n=1 Tax=Arthrobacter sp. zg-Y179 TaxID=2894188 RepID=UPI001E5BE76B|nr:hypothetical protein [Arthrobacter sp. zg-Y179]MCC9174225.1 hypothetical protein [Arthrobacter sp. zg-Y179]